MDFRKNQGDQIAYQTCEHNDRPWIRIRLRDAAEFLLTKDYTDNWSSEMNERFCFWAFSDWERALTDGGFRVHPDSRAYQNPWIIENRFAGRAEMIDPHTFENIAFPPTNVLIVAEKFS